MLWTVLAFGLTLLPATGWAQSSLTPEGLFGGQATQAERSSADEEHEFETDRDSFTPATSTVLPGRFLTESAWSFIDHRDVQDSHSLPELVLRYGVTDWLELRFGTNYEVGGESDSISGADLGQEPGASLPGRVSASNVSYGIKALISVQEGWRPESSLIVAGSTPTSGESTATDLICTYVWGWTFENDWKWDSSIRYGTGHAEADNFNRWAPSTVLKIPIADRWDIHAEYFGLFTADRADNSQTHYISPGLAWKLSENFELGLRVGWGLNDQSSRMFSNVGFGWQF
ncbi:MAG: transporter [Planctomycetaceae bacterium]